VANVQQANVINQTEKGFYSLTAQNIRAKWANGIFEHDPDQVRQAQSELADWNQKNPDQRIVANMPAIMRKVQQMSLSKDQRIAATAPKAMRQQMQRETAAMRAQQ
jgi:hypothetical protein